MKQLMAGGGIIVLGTTLIPLLSSLCFMLFKTGSISSSIFGAH